MPGYSVTFSVVDEATREIERINREIRRMREPMERQSRAIQQFIEVSGLKKVSEGFREITRTTRDAFESMSRLVPVMASITGAASIAGIAELVTGWADFSRSIELSATRAGATTDEMQDLATATQLAGGDTTDMTESLKGLEDQLYKARISGGEAAAWFRKANISIVDANGNLRRAADVLPEVIKYLDQIPNPAERMRVAIGLGSQNLALLAEEFERSGRTMPQWLAEAQKFTKLSQDQIEQSHRYEQAVGALSAAFTSLRNQVGAAIADALTPLIKTFAAWVQTHQPQIVRAIDELARKFGEWIRGIDWAAVGRGAAQVGAALLAIVNNLDKVKEAAEIVAGVFALKWAIGIGTSIATVMRALGTAAAVTPGFAIAGTGLLGALAAVAGGLLLIEQTIEHWPEIKQASIDLWNKLGDAVARVWSNIRGIPDAMRGGALAGHAPGVAAPYSNLPPNAGPPRPGRARGAAAPPQPVPNIQGMTAQERNFLALAEHYESQGRNVPNYRFDPTHTAQGYWQITNSNWKRLAPKLGITAPDAMHASRADQAKVALAVLREQGQGAWTHYDPRLAAAIARGDRAPAAAIAGIPGMPGAQGPPGAIASNRPLGGSVDVTVTHRNPPAGSSVSATATGDASVATPRVEFADIGAI